MFQMKALTLMMGWLVLVAVAGGLFLSTPPKVDRSQAGLEAAAIVPAVSPVTDLAAIEIELSTPEGMAAAQKRQEMLADVAIETARLDALQKAIRARMQAGR